MSKAVKNMKDNETTIREAQQWIIDFCSERNWDQYHNPKDVAIGIATEAGELLDIFRFQNGDDIDKILEPGSAKREHVEEELADVFFFTLRFAQRNGIDLASALKSKIAKNAKKYPVSKCYGINAKYSDLN